MLLAASALLFSACGKKDPELTKIAVIKGQPVYMDELEVLGRLAHAKDPAMKDIAFESEAGQKAYKEKAANLYNTLIDMYVLKYTAEEMGVTPSSQEVDQKMEQIKTSLKDVEYKNLLALAGNDPDRLRETVQDQMSTERLIAKVLSEATGTTPTETEIGDYYYQNEAVYQHPKMMRVSHIFIAAPKEKGDSVRVPARAKAEQLRKMIGDNPGTTFVGLAQKYSEDTDSAPRGGDLGFIQRNDPKVNKPFEDAAFALKEGEVSPVVETDYGYHIIWATDMEKSLGEAREEILRLLSQKKKVEHYTRWLEESRRNMDIDRLFNPETFTVKDEKATS